MFPFVRLLNLSGRPDSRDLMSTRRIFSSLTSTHDLDARFWILEDFKVLSEVLFIEGPGPCNEADLLD